ncbi:hypothetical protein CEXT_268571 [Caerostris extrusa]|uniref:Uncharacterized protein n=1 Tax=Caerostris extrusa TaxID=172846 RepID=A0AAV4Y1K4_CAEEX|nr:hypothetical protein CEXT_268571 [Caerostris extrusa]
MKTKGAVLLAISLNGIPYPSSQLLLDYCPLNDASYHSVLKSNYRDIISAFPTGQLKPIRQIENPVFKFLPYPPDKRQINANGSNHPGRVGAHR